MNERMLLATDQEMWAIHHARLAVKGPVLDIMEKWLTRNGWHYKELKPAPPKAPEGFQTVYYFECLQCGEEVLPEHVGNHTHEPCHDNEVEKLLRKE